MKGEKPCELYRHFDKDGRLLYVGIAVSTLARLAGHRSGSHWFGQITRIEIERFPSQCAARQAELEAIEREKPLHNLWTDTRKGINARNPEWQAEVDRLQPLIEAAGYKMRGNACYNCYVSVWDAIQRGEQPSKECIKRAVNGQVA
jgi:excinuclease UvrABC nuclease subunit